VADVLVVGSGGQLGFELLRASWPHGWRVIGKTHAELDVSDARAVRVALAELKPALVVNAAAYTQVDRAEDEPERAFAVNRDGAAHLADGKIPLIHVSTDYVFDGEKSGPYLESDAVAPLGVYGASKLAGEEAVRAREPRHVILRTAWVFGAHGQNFVKTMLRLAAERDIVRVVADQRGCPTPAADIARAIVRIATCIADGSASFGTFHFAGMPATSWHDFARAIFEEQRTRGGRVPELQAISSDQYPTRARRAKNSELGGDAIRKTYALEAPSWRAGLSAMLDEIGRRK
jgi:dTDP-4-dehydrorhamnose reductase